MVRFHLYLMVRSRLFHTVSPIPSHMFRNMPPHVDSPYHSAYPPSMNQVTPNIPLPQTIPHISYLPSQHVISSDYRRVPRRVSTPIDSMPGGPSYEHKISSKGLSFSIVPPFSPLQTEPLVVSHLPNLQPVNTSFARVPYDQYHVKQPSYGQTHYSPNQQRLDNGSSPYPHAHEEFSSLSIPPVLGGVTLPTNHASRALLSPPSTTPHSDILRVSGEIYQSGTLENLNPIDLRQSFQIQT